MNLLEVILAIILAPFALLSLATIVVAAVTTVTSLYRRIRKKGEDK